MAINKDQIEMIFYITTNFIPSEAFSFSFVSKSQRQEGGRAGVKRQNAIWR